MKIDDEKRIEIQAARQSAEAMARKKAVDIYSAIRSFAQGTHNSGNVFEQIIAGKVLEEEPILFSGFWGVGGKRVPDTYDQGLLSDLEALRESVGAVYSPGARVQIMLADEHGRFNRFSNPQVYEYLVRIQDQAAQKGIDTLWLSDLYQEWGINVPNIDSPLDPSSPAYALFWENSKYSRQREQLIESAARHNQLVEDPLLAAFHYAVMRLQEARFLASFFPDSILVVNASKELAKLLLPEQLPHIYLKTGPAWFRRESR